MGGGNDKIVGSPYADGFGIYASAFGIAAMGTRYIDGGDNLGKDRWGNNASDNLDVYVVDQSQAALIKVKALTSTTGEEGAAKTNGFTNKVVLTGAGNTETVLAYIKNIEYVNIQIWNDRNGDGLRQWDQDATKNEMTGVSNIRLVVDVNAIRVSTTDATKTEWGSKLSDAYHMAWINGTDANDTIVVKSLVPSSTTALQNLYKRGLFVDAGAGDDTITGSDYSDNIVGGSGNDLVDGGQQIAPTGTKGQDVFEIRLVAANQSDAALLLSRVKVLPTSERAGYQWKVEQRDANNVVVQVDYLKNIEAVNINVNSPSNQWLAGRWQNIALNVGEMRLNPTDSSKTEWGSKVSDQMHFAWVNGTPSNEFFDYTGTTIVGAETVSAAGKALMDQNKRGLWVDLGGGTDEIVGSPYGDSFNISGPGIRYIDGGLNDGTTPWGNRAIDTLDVFVSSRSAAATIKVFPIDPSASAGTEEGIAKARAFTSKVVTTDTSGNILTVLAYVKNIEFVNIQVWTDINGDEQRQWDADPNKNEMSWYGNIRLAVDVNEMRRSATDPTKTEWGSKVSEQYHFAWINGTEGDDTINAKTLVSSNLLALQDQYKRGLWVDASQGDDKITGSDYSDNINGGLGNDEVDGGSQIAPTGEKGRDVFEIRLVAANQADAKALISSISILPSDRSEFQWKIVRPIAGGGSETDYLKNIEAISINVNDANNTWLAGQWRNLALDVGEIRLNPTDPTKVDNGNKLVDQMHFAWVNGVSANEKFDYTGTVANSETVSAATKTLMEQNKRGLWVDMRGGDDIAVGSPYGDNFNIVLKDSGIDYFDGGANSGTSPWGQNAQDTVDVFVETDAEAKTIQVVKLVAPQITTATTDSPDVNVFGSGYTHKLMAGTRTLAYLKNIESVNIQKWIDTNGNDQRDWQTEVTYVSGFGLAATIGYPNNGDATKNTVWINGTNSSDTINVPELLKTLPSSTDPKLNWAGTKLEININAGQGGSDTIVGSSGPDMITVTTWNNAVNYVDGGDNIGRQTWANSTSTNAYDSLQLLFDKEGGARSVEIYNVTASDDPEAFAKGYLYKIKTFDSITYIKNVEQVALKVWTDLNGNGNNDWGNEVVGFGFPALQTAQVSMVYGVKGSSSVPPSNFFVMGSEFTPNIDASSLINDFITTRKLYPTSSTDLPASFKLSDIAKVSSSFGAYIAAGNGDHNIKGTDFADYILVSNKGKNIINGGTDIGYWLYNNTLTLSKDTVRVTEEVEIQSAYLGKSFIKLATGTAKAFSIGLTPSNAGDDVTGTYTVTNDDRPFIVLLPKAGKVSFNATSDQMQKIWTDLQDADTAAKFQTALDNAKAVADLKYSIFAGYVDLDGNGTREFMSFANLDAPVVDLSKNEVSFALAANVDNFLSTANLLGSDRFNKERHHLINLADNANWISGTAATSADIAAITGFALAKGVAQKDYKFALVSYDDFNKLTGVQLMDDIESIEFRLWIDANQDLKQGGAEFSGTYLNYSLESDNAIHLTTDLGMSIVGGMQYSGTYSGTFLNETINLKTEMQPGIGAAEQAKNLGIRMADVSGNDSITGTDFNDFFWLCAGQDTIDGGKGNNDRIAFYWKPAASGTLSTTQSGNVITIAQTVAGTSTNLARITLTDIGGTIEQLSSTYALGYGSNTNFTIAGAPDTFKNVEELIILLDPSLKNTDGTYQYTTGGITDVNPFVLKLKPTADYPVGADATKTTINFNGTPNGEVIDAAAMMAALPTSTIAKDDWRNSKLSTYINLSGGGDTVIGTANADIIDAGIGTNYIDGGTEIGRTNWTPAWIETGRSYWGAEAPSDQLRFEIKSTAEVSNLGIIRLDAGSSGTDLSAFNNGYTIKATMTGTKNGAAVSSINYLKNVEYVGFRLWNDANNNGIRESSELSSYGYINLDKPIVNWRFIDLNDPDFGPFYFNLNGGNFVNVINAQSAIDDFIANKKAYPVPSVDKVTPDLPANFTLSSVVNYANARGAYIMAGTGDHYVTGTNFSDTIVVSNTGYNWIDGGTDEGYAKYDTSTGAGTIRIARDNYRVAQSVADNAAVSLTNNVSASNFKVVRLSDNYDLLTSTTVDSAVTTLISNAKTSMMTKYNIASGTTPEFAVVKYDPAAPTTVIGIDLLRNIELFDVRNWFDLDNNGRPTGAEVGTTSPVSYLLAKDITVYETADQAYQVIAGKSYAGLATGTSFADTGNMQTLMDEFLNSNKNLSNNNKGLMIADQGGNDTLTGTMFDDLFMLSSGSDTLTGGDGTQDRAAVYWKPATSGGTPSIQVVKSTADKTIKVTQTIGTTTTELVRFTLVNTGGDATNPYWEAKHMNTTYALGWSDSNFGTDKLYGIEQAVVTLHPDLLKADGSPTITLTGLTNNSLVIDLSLS
ncbi:hypothetical protein [Limnohabitans sp. Hippo4]|uniref:hypothetical protein n=1 Tax=Limnohabitans sp. Hippo4 TaxID=1826167 RepID=UPI0011B254BF|nr:hypothetical protein [Limnohabitans sp. Hippo4]